MRRPSHHPSARRTMLRSRLTGAVSAIALAIAVALPAPAHAEGLDNLYAAINGLTMFLTDPVWETIEPGDTLMELPGSPYTSHLLGPPVGVVKAVHRAGMAVFDLAFFPFWVFPVMSPEPRWALIDDVEYE